MLRQRAEIIAAIRAFFADRGVLEVETPVLARYGVTDPHLESLQLADGAFLQTSPEFAMKRLLAAGSGSIYQLGKAFRADECGRRHNPEFTLLEWYRTGFDHDQLMAEVGELLQQILPCSGYDTYSYQALFEQQLAVDPLRASAAELEQLARSRIDIQMDSARADDWLDLLFAELIEPQLGWQRPAFVTDYPASMAALARLGQNERGDRVARRFEVFVRGVELGNGYHELTDPLEQQRRFDQDNRLRQQLGRPVREADPDLLAALQAGLPDCAGVALGVDRLVMLALGKHSLAEVMAFPWPRP